MQKASAAKYATSIDLARKVPAPRRAICPDPVLTALAMPEYARPLGACSKAL